MTELVRRRRRARVSQIDWYANQKRLSQLIAAEYTPKEIAKLFETTPNAVRAAAKRFRFRFAHDRTPVNADPIPFKAPAEHLENHKGHIALIRQARPQGFLGHWSFKPGGFLYREAA